MSGRLLVVGASGLVGSEVVRAASAWSTHGVARHVGGLATEAMDLLDVPAIEQVVTRVNPDAVVIASAWPWVDGCEQDPARSERENVQTVKNLLQVLGPAVRVVFFSTEHVFDGLSPAYDEAAPTHPLSVYAKHKRDVEDLLLRRGRCLVARTSYVFGAEARRKNFMYRVIDASEQRTPLKVPSAQAGMPTWSRWLATSALDLLGRGFEGLAHLTGPDVLTKAEWARLLATGLSLPNVEIVEVPWQDSGQIAPRPERVRLLSTRHELHHPPLLELLTRERAALLSKVN
ncbi:MAG: sugar nucleotide-binding protein [Archangium sp.]|nr:sugar nucleotide-binding protein [Archangium sp.]